MRIKFGEGVGVLGGVTTSHYGINQQQKANEATLGNKSANRSI